MRRFLPAAHMLLPLLVLLQASCSRAAERLAEIRLPPGFAIAIYADNLPGARSMTLGAKGTLFVGTRQAGKVYAVVDQDGCRSSGSKTTRP